MSKENIIMKVPDMSCNHCVNTIKKAVSNLNGVDSVNIDLESKMVSIDYDNAKVGVDTLRDTIQDQGYTVK